MTTTQHPAAPHADLLAEALEEKFLAWQAFNAAKTNKAQREADENLNFWIGRVAMLSAR